MAGSRSTPGILGARSTIAKARRTSRKSGGRRRKPRVAPPRDRLLPSGEQGHSASTLANQAADVSTAARASRTALARSVASREAIGRAGEAPLLVAFDVIVGAYHETPNRFEPYAVTHHMPAVRRPKSSPATYSRGNRTRLSGPAIQRSITLRRAQSIDPSRNTASATSRRDSTLCAAIREHRKCELQSHLPL